MPPIVIAMLVVWSVVIAAAIFVEYFTCQIISVSFVPAAVISLVLAAFDIHVGIQIPVFFGAGTIFVLIARPLFKKYLQKASAVSFTVRNKNIGQKFRLVANVVDGKSSVVISDVTWTVKVIENEDTLAKGDMVEIVDFEGNKALVKAASAASAVPPAA